MPQGIPCRGVDLSSVNNVDISPNGFLGWAMLGVGQALEHYLADPDRLPDEANAEELRVLAGQYFDYGRQLADAVIFFLKKV
jgi:hypothetical protein